jgi:hypothetical protein
VPICVVYVGDLEDPNFSWDGGDWNGNAPRHLSPDFPPTFGPTYGPWSIIYRRIRDGQLPGRQTDWGAWVAPVTGREVVAVVEELYGDGYPMGDTFPHLQAALDRLLRWLESIDPARLYALVAMEVS